MLIFIPYVHHIREQVHVCHIICFQVTESIQISCSNLQHSESLTHALIFAVTYTDSMLYPEARIIPLTLCH